MASHGWFPQAREMLVATGSTVGELVRRRRSRRKPPPPPPPVITTSSPGQIADLQQEYGAEMEPTPAPPQARGADD